MAFMVKASKEVAYYEEASKVEHFVMEIVYFIKIQEVIIVKVSIISDDYFEAIIHIFIIIHIFVIIDQFN